VCCLAVPVTPSWCCAIPKASPSLYVLGRVDFFPTRNSSCRAACFRKQRIVSVKQQHSTAQNDKIQPE